MNLAKLSYHSLRKISINNNFDSSFSSALFLIFFCVGKDGWQYMYYFYIYKVEKNLNLTNWPNFIKKQS